MHAAIRRNHADAAIINARQVFALLKQPLNPPIMPMPWICSLAAPTHPNAYTDGSWQFPLARYFSLGGAGVWWPSRCLGRHRASDAELKLAYIQQTSDGVHLATHIGGYHGSSTRTELAAGIIALSAHGPVHLASDSEAFVNQANSILTAIPNGSNTRRCWATTSDGDLWYHFEQAATIKGPHSIRITWVKGHATDAHVDAGVTTRANQLGNALFRVSVREY